MLRIKIDGPGRCCWYPEAQGDRANGGLNAGFRYRPALRARYCFAGSDKKHAADRQKESRQLARTSGAADIAADALSQSDFNDLTILAHRFLAGTPSMLAAVRPSDLTDEKGPTTYRGTRRSYYNWPPKLLVPLESLSVLPLAESVSDAMNSRRRTFSPEWATSAFSPARRGQKTILKNAQTRKSLTLLSRPMVTSCRADWVISST